MNTYSTNLREIELNDGHRIPNLGYGVFQIPPDATTDAVSMALHAGYRLIDTASAYGNEEAVGRAVTNSNIARDEITVTTKLWNDDQGYYETMRAFDRSQAALGLDYVDIYLIHWPRPRLDRYIDSWKAMIRLLDEERVRSIGVSNFNKEQIKLLTSETGILPAVNQVEFHPGKAQIALHEYHQSQGICTQAWSPLGRGQTLLEHPTLRMIGASKQCSAAQIVLAWHLQKGIIPLPRSKNRSRIESNIAIQGIRLDPNELAAIDVIQIPDLVPPPASVFDIS